MSRSSAFCSMRMDEPRLMDVREEDKMKTMWKPMALSLLAIIVWGVPSVVWAESPKVLSIVAVKVKGDQDAYLAKVKKLNALVKKVEGGGTMRVWRAALAGPNSDTIYVGIEYENLEAYAKATSKLEADADWKKQIKELDASGMREVEGRSLFVEVTPQ